MAKNIGKNVAKRPLGPPVLERPGLPTPCTTRSTNAKLKPDT
jgi:hypothetical protein